MYEIGLEVNDYEEGSGGIFRNNFVNTALADVIIHMNLLQLWAPLLPRWVMLIILI